jgi:hypothetical protein
MVTAFIGKILVETASIATAPEGNIGSLWPTLAGSGVYYWIGVGVAGVFALSMASAIFLKIFDTMTGMSTYIAVRSIAVIGPLVKKGYQTVQLLISLINAISSIATVLVIPYVTVSEIISLFTTANSVTDVAYSLAAIAGVISSTLLFSALLRYAEGFGCYRAFTGWFNKILTDVLYPMLQRTEPVPATQSHYYIPARRWGLDLLDIKKFIEQGVKNMSWALLHRGSVTGFYKSLTGTAKPDIQNAFVPFYSLRKPKIENLNAPKTTELDIYNKWLLATKGPMLYVWETYETFGLTWKDLVVWIGGTITNRVLGPFMPVWISSIYYGNVVHLVSNAKFPLSSDSLQKVLQKDDVLNVTTPAPNSEVTFLQLAHMVATNTTNLATVVGGIRTGCNTLQNQKMEFEVQLQFDNIKTTLNATAYNDTHTMLDRMTEIVGCDPEFKDQVLWWAYLFFPSHLKQLLENPRNIELFPSAHEFIEPIVLHKDSSYNIVLEMMRQHIKQGVRGIKFNSDQLAAMCSNPFAMLIDNSGTTYDRELDEENSYTATGDALGKVISKVSTLKIDYGNQTLFSTPVAPEAGSSSSQPIIANAPDVTTEFHGDGNVADAKTEAAFLERVTNIAKEYVGYYIPQVQSLFSNEGSKHCHGKGRSYQVHGAHGLNRANSEEANPSRDLADCDSEILLFQEDHIALPVPYIEMPIFRNALKEMLRDLSLRMYKDKFNETALRRITLADITNAAESVTSVDSSNTQRTIGSMAEDVFRVATEKYCSTKSCDVETEEEEEEGEGDRQNGEVCVKIAGFPLWNNGLQRVEAFPDIAGYGRERLAKDTYESVFYFLLLELVVSYSRARLLWVQQHQQQQPEPLQE